MRLNPHLTFDGQCEAAFAFYEKCLGGKILLMMPQSDSPMILHATIAVGQPRGFSVLLNIDDAAEADRIFQSLAEGGAVQMPLQETFWALRFGMLTDRFGTPWMIN